MFSDPMPLNKKCPGWMFDGTNTSFSILECLWEVLLRHLGFDLLRLCCWSWQTMPTTAKSDTTCVLPEMDLAARRTAAQRAWQLFCNRELHSQWIMSCSTEWTWTWEAAQSDRNFDLNLLLSDWCWDMQRWTWQWSDLEAFFTFSVRERPCTVCCRDARRSPWQARKWKSEPGTWALAAWSVISVKAYTEKRDTVFPRITSLVGSYFFNASFFLGGGGGYY